MNLILFTAKILFAKYLFEINKNRNWSTVALKVTKLNSHKIRPIKSINLKIIGLLNSSLFYQTFFSFFFNLAHFEDNIYNIFTKY